MKLVAALMLLSAIGEAQRERCNGPLVFSTFYQVGPKALLRQSER